MSAATLAFMHAHPTSLKARVAAEMRKVLLTTLYFLVGFNLLVVLIVLLVPGEQALGPAMLTASLLALVVGKVVVLAEGFIDRLVQRGDSFLLAVAQRSGLFTLAVLLALALEAVLHGVIGESMSLQEALHHTLEEATLARFVARALYLMVLFSLYALLFELDAYFAPLHLSDVVASRFVTPQISQAVTMRLGLVDALDPAHADARLRMLQTLYVAFVREAEELGAELDLFGGDRGVLIWQPAESFDGAQAQKAYTELSAHLREEEAWWTAETGVPLRLKAVVTRGELQTLEIGTGRRRQILRSGSALERAEQRFRTLDEARLVIED